MVVSGLSERILWCTFRSRAYHGGGIFIQFGGRPIGGFMTFSTRRWKSSSSVEVRSLLGDILWLEVLLLKSFSYARRRNFHKICSFGESSVLHTSKVTAKLMMEHISKVAKSKIVVIFSALIDPLPLEPRVVSRQPWPVPSVLSHAREGPFV